MMHYRDEESVEQTLSENELRMKFENCLPNTHKDFLWMHVKLGTKVINVVGHAQAALNSGEFRCLVWSGSGGGVAKAITCAEILKRSHSLYQVTRMCYTTVEEHWKPKSEGLDEIVVTRKIPTLHILMSLDELPDSIEGLQKPKTISKLWQQARQEEAQTKRLRNNNNNSQQEQQHQQDTQSKADIDLGKTGYA